MRRFLWQLLSLLLLLALAGCSENTVVAGQNGIRVNAGEWASETDDGAFMLEFSVAYDGANIFVSTYSFPCGKKTSYVLPPRAHC